MNNTRTIEINPTPDFDDTRGPWTLTIHTSHKDTYSLNCTAEEIAAWGQYLTDHAADLAAREDTEQ